MFCFVIKSLFELTNISSLTFLKIQAREDQIARHRREIDDLHNKNRETSEVLAEREGQLRLSNMNLQASQKQARHHTQEVSIASYGTLCR